MDVIRTVLACLYLVLVWMIGVPYFRYMEKHKSESVALQKSYGYARMVSRGIIALTGSRLTVEGAEHIPKDGAVLFVVNHQSYMDIPVMMSVCEQPVGFIAKEGLSRVPFMGRWFAYLKCVLIARGDARKALEAILQAAKLLQSGHRLVLFPEGTRSADGKLGEFKAGSLKAAQKGKAVIVPVALQGMRECMSRGGVIMHKSQMKATILPAISAETVQQMETKELSTLLRNQIGQVLGQTTQENIYE